MRADRLSASRLSRRAGVAQLVEHFTRNEGVIGSNPIAGFQAMHLSNHHRNTVAKIFDHQSSGNVEWREVRSLLDAVGEIDQEHDGKLRVKVGPETEVIEVPKHKDIDRQLIVNLRRMLSQAGLEPGAPAATEDERSRDYGDSRWGKPTQDD